MKKILMFAALFAATVGLKAQESKLSYGVKAGVNLSNFYGNNDYKATAGFKIGGFVEYQLAPSFYIQPALEYTTKGAKLKNAQTGTIGIPGVGFGDVTGGYLEMPIMGVYKIDVAPQFKITFNAGPYFAAGIAGKSDYFPNGSVSSHHVNTFGSGGAIRHLDIGVGGGVGAEYDHYLVNLGYECGLTNITPNNKKMGNTNAFLTVGYKF